MDNLNNNVGGKKKKKRVEKNRNPKGEYGAESAVGATSFGEQGSDLGGNQELETDYGVSSSGLSDVNEGLESKQGREEQGAQAVMEEASDAIGNATLSIYNGLSKDGEAPSKFDDSGSFEEEGFKDCEAPVKREFKNDDVNPPSSSTGSNDYNDPPSANDEGIAINDVQDPAPAEEATDNSIASDMTNDVENTSNAHEVISPNGITVEPADPAYEFRHISSGVNMEEKISSVGQLPSETQVNQVTNNYNVDMEEASDAIGNATLSINNALSKDGEVPHRFDDSRSFEEDGFKDCEGPVEGESENDDVNPPSNSSGFNDDKDPPSANGEGIGINDVQDPATSEEATNNSVASNIAKDVENTSNAHEVISLKGITVEPADPAYEFRQISSELSERASDSGANMEEKISSVGQLPSETQVNQVVGGSSGLDLQQNQYETQGVREMSAAEDKASTYFSIGNSQASVMDSLNYYRDERNRSMSVDEPFVDALDRLSESRSTSLDGSTYAIDGGLVDKERLIIEIHDCKDALERSNIEMQVEKLAEEKVNLEVKLQEAVSVKSGVKTDSDGNDNQLLEQERLKQVIHSWEQEKSEMAKVLKEMEAQLQAETEQRAHLSHQLEITQQNLNELSEKKDALTRDLDAKATDMEDMIKQKVLLEEKLQMSKLEGESLAKSANQYCSTLQQKVEDLEAEKAAALSKLMGVQRNVEVEAMHEAQDSSHCLEAQVERFAKEAKNREEKLRSELQILSDENHNFLTQLDEHAKNMMKTEHENQLVKNELAELKCVLNETNKAKEWITRDFEAEVTRLRQQIEELNCQLCHVKDEMDEVKDENLKLIREKSQFEATIGQLESSLFTNERNIQDNKGQNVELSQKHGQFEDIRAKYATFDEKCADMVCQTAQLANERNSLLLEVDALQKSVLEKDMLVQASVDSHYDLKYQFDKVIEKLIAHIEEVIQAEMLVADPSMQRISYLEASLFLLIEKYKVSLSQVDIFQTSLFELASGYGHLWEKQPTMPLDVILREVFRCKEMELTEVKERLDEMNSIRNQQEAEVGDIRSTLCKYEENLKEVKAENSKLRSDLEQTETRLSSVREKLSLAVSKGKGLVQQRDALRQELIEKTNGLEKCQQELQLKNDALHEVEVKAAERLKSLESELSDVQNSASAFQESLLHKELILQKIENVLEVNLPDVLQSKEILEKIEWLVRSSPGEDNAPCLRDLKISELNETNITHYKSHKTNGDNYLMDKRSLDDLKLKYDELEGKYCSLIEKSSLMEQSLLERNHIIQKWEEILDSVHVPTTMESIEPESKIEWICRELSEARRDVDFQHKIENVQKVVGSADVELEESKMRINSLEETFLKEKQEKEALVENLEGLSRALSQAQQDVVHFQQEFKDVQEVANSYVIELEESKMRINSLEESLQKEKQEKEALVKNLEELRGALSRTQLDAAHFQHEIENVRRVAESSAIELEESKTRISSLDESLSGEKQEREALVKNTEELSRTLCLAQQDVTHFQHELENVQRVADLATIELQESKTKQNSLEEILLKGEQEKEALVKSLEEIKHKYKILSEESAQDATQESSCNELVDQHQEVQGLQSNVESNIVDKSLLEDKCMRRLLDIVNETMRDQDFEDLTSYGSSGEHLEGCLRKLIGKLNALSEEVKKIKETENLEAEELQSLLALLDATNLTLMEMSKKQQETSSTVESHRAEINSLVDKNQIMSEELVMVKDQKDALKAQLEEAEERSSLIREKLAMAVKKGKGLVQQRDSLKQSVDEKIAELEHGRAELQVRDLAINEHQERISNLTSEIECFKRIEADIDCSRNQCAELENLLLDSNSKMQRLMDRVDAINIPGHILSRDPIEKIEWLGKLVDRLYQNISAAEDEAMKFKEEADILVTKLDEACANVRTLEEELRVAENKSLILTNEKIAAEAESNREIQEVKDVLAARTEELCDVQTSVDFQISELVKLHVSLNNLRKDHRSLLSLLASDFSKKLNTLRSTEFYLQDILSQLDASKGSKIPGAELSNKSTCVPMELHEEIKYLVENAVLETYIEAHVDHLLHDGLHKGQKVNQLLSYLEQALNGCTGDLELIKEKFGVYCSTVDQGAIMLSQLLQHTREDVVTLVESLESLRKNVANLEVLKNDKDNEILMLGENITMMVNACNNVTEELQNLKLQIISDSLSSREEITTLGSMCSSDNSLVMQLPQHVNVMYTAYMKTAENLLFIIKDLTNTANENSKQYQREISTLKVKLQQAESGEAEKLRICTELESKLTNVEAILNDIARERDLNKARICDLESQIASMENDSHAFESSIKEFETREASMKAIQEEVALLHDVLSAKNQAFENLNKKMQELENDCRQKQAALEDSESSCGKAFAELSDSSSRFEELRQLSEGLIAEVDNLHLQLESRDEEIAQLKKEALKSTYDIPAVMKNIEKKNQEIEALQMGLENMIAKLGVDHMLLNQKEESRMQTMLRTLEDSIFAIISDYESFKADAQNKDFLLHDTQNTVGKLCGKVEMLEASLREKQTHSEIFQMEKHPQPSVTATEVPEIEELGQSSKTTVSSVAIAPHVRSTRKASSNHLALSIDTESENLISDSEDHDKGHAFKSMSSTGLIPKSSQSVADWVDGIWVSGGRMLMRQPMARMGLIVYWIAIHLWMVATVL